MQLVKPSTFGEFRHLAEAFLLANEAEHGLIYGIANSPAPPDSYCALVVADERVVAATIRTIAKAVVSREDSPGAMALIAADAVHDPGFRGILGPPESVESFVRGSNRNWTHGRGTTIYVCDSVVRPLQTSGQRHVAMAADGALLSNWIEAFNAEALSTAVTAEMARSAADRYIASGTMHLWLVDQTPVACAAVVGPTPRAIRIGPVYTPPQYRRHGYASALVADLAQDQLDRGKAFTYLYADRDNQTSNSIYQKIGYRIVAQCDERWLV
jgi:predicted GNAT family acetyltransferase